MTVLRRAATTLGALAAAVCFALAVRFSLRGEHYLAAYEATCVAADLALFYGRIGRALNRRAVARSLALLDECSREARVVKLRTDGKYWCVA